MRPCLAVGVGAPLGKNIVPANGYWMPVPTSPGHFERALVPRRHRRPVAAWRWSCRRAFVVGAAPADAVAGAGIAAVEVRDQRLVGRGHADERRGPEAAGTDSAASFDVAAVLAEACGALPPMTPAITRPTAIQNMPTLIARRRRNPSHARGAPNNRKPLPCRRTASRKNSSVTPASAAMWFPASPPCWARPRRRAPSAPGDRRARAARVAAGPSAGTAAAPTGRTGTPWAGR